MTLLLFERRLRDPSTLSLSPDLLDKFAFPSQPWSVNPNTKGIGIIIVAKQPSKVPAPCTPILSNICLEKSGNPATTDERSIILIATVDAALFQLIQFLSKVFKAINSFTRANKRQRDR